jgi:hypothetical protein
MQSLENLELLRLVEAEEVARLVAVSPSGLKRHACGVKPLICLRNFPAPVRSGRGQKLYWLLQDVANWLKEQSTYQPTKQQENQVVSLAVARRGRPRKGVGV